MAVGRTYIDPWVASGLVRRDVPGETITPREREVVRHLARGRSNKEIANELSIGEETVKSHVSNLLAKLEAENRAQAVVQALRRGLIAIEDLY